MFICKTRDNNGLGLNFNTFRHSVYAHLDMESVDMFDQAPGQFDESLKLLTTGKTKFSMKNFCQ